MKEQDKWEALRAQELDLDDQLARTERERYRTQELALDWQAYIPQAKETNQELLLAYQGSDQAQRIELTIRELEGYSLKIEDNYESLIQAYRKKENRLLDDLEAIARQKRKLGQEEKKSW
ncbi:hypothetical protein [Streptococcus oricebi]|uniref:Uncharacterized protein n=1 Tax=Streptococcus oricebi TaxID=1547447 RepID=A0ABS5B4A2_9STRE|nr:hypothetical protein [Streptococcus oricebi]MBP2623639.1 hypothetical protein [Streptococcus oricebi]